MSKNSFDIHEVIEMALSDHTTFRDIERLYGLSPDDVKRIMRQISNVEAMRRGGDGYENLQTGANITNSKINLESGTN